MVCAVVAETQGNFKYYFLESVLFYEFYFVRCMATAILSYRTWPFSKQTNKMIHLFWHVAGVICLGVGLKVCFA